MVMANMWSRRGGCPSSLTLIQRQFFKPLVAVVQSLSRVPLFVTPWTVARQAPLSMGSPGKNTGVGCHFLLRCMKVESESEVTQSCLTLSDPMDCSLPGSSIHGIFQATVLEWVAIAFSPILLDSVYVCYNTIFIFLFLTHFTLCNRF